MGAALDCCHELPSVDTWLCIPKAYVRREQWLKELLTVSNGAHFAQRRMGYDSKLEPYFFLYRETPDAFFVPRNALRLLRADPHKLGWAEPTFWQDIRRVKKTPPPGGPPYAAFAHAVTPRPRQHQAIAALTVGDYDRILTLACGAGKTVIAIAALCETAPKSLPALIVVNTQELFDQWRDRIREHTCLGPLRVGRVQGPVCDYQNTPFVVAMIQTLSQRKYPEAFYRHFRCVVFDEAHRLGAPVFGSVAPMFACKRFGLSATPNRQDKLDQVFKAHLGEVCYTDLSQDLVATTFFVETPLKPNMRHFRNYRNPAQVDFVRLQTYLSRHQGRNEQSLQLIARLAARGRKILVVGERVEQLQTLAKAYGPEAAPCVGAMDRAQRREALTRKVIFGIDKITAEALDQPDIDTLVLLTPKSNPNVLQQAYGRILRQVPGKQAPVVICFEDAHISVMRARCHKFRAWLHHNRFPIAKAAL